MWCRCCQAQAVDRHNFAKGPCPGISSHLMLPRLLAVRWTIASALLPAPLRTAYARTQTYPSPAAPAPVGRPIDTG